MGNCFTRSGRVPPVTLLKYTVLKEPEIEMAMPAMSMLPPLPLHFLVPSFMDSPTVKTSMWLNANGNQFLNSDSGRPSPCPSRASTFIEGSTPPSPVLRQTSWLYRLGKTNKDLPTLETELNAELAELDKLNGNCAPARRFNVANSNLRPVEPQEPEYGRIAQGRIQVDPHFFTPDVLFFLYGLDFLKHLKQYDIEGLKLILSRASRC